MARILVVEDEVDIRQTLHDFFRTQGYQTILAGSGEEALEKVGGRRARCDLVLLDLMLPDRDGFDVCRELKAQFKTLPIIMLTAKSEEVDKITGLELGADDYVTKPFSLRELHARVRAVLRRVQSLGTKPETIGEVVRIGEAQLNTKTFEILRGKDAYRLSTLEYDLLKYLILHEGEIVSREQLLNDVWGYDHYPTTRTIDTHVLNLRKKLEINPNQPRHIITIYGTGYKFVC